VRATGASSRWSGGGGVDLERGRSEYRAWPRPAAAAVEATCQGALGEVGLQPWEGPVVEVRGEL